MPDRPPLILPPDHFGLYIHVPFCARKCRYCDFASQPLAGQQGDPVAAYLAALRTEVALRAPLLDRPCNSIFIGGGTPTILDGAGLQEFWEIIAAVPRYDDAEITLEANPGTLSDEVLSAISELPFTRVSLGVQSLRDDELALLGRVHTAAEVPAAVAALRHAGIQHLNLDLIYALPGQTPAQWEETLTGAIALQPEHLSAYSLILEAGTPLCADVASGLLPEPDEDAEAEMAAHTVQRLTDAGYQQYEVSNYARPGCHSRHNLAYWLGRDYLGLGPAAASCMGGTRWRNADDLAAYSRGLRDGVLPIAYAERLAAPTWLLERVMLGLRLRDGFNLAEAERACGCTLEAVTSDVYRALLAEGMLVRAGDNLRLSDDAFRLANAVVTRLMMAESPER